MSIGLAVIPKQPSPINNFLDKLDGFNIEDYIKAIHFNDIKMPSIAFSLPTTKVYSGIEQFKESEIDFIKATVLSKSMEDVLLYSDMPITEMAQDAEFSKKYMFGLAMMLKKGLHINFIHDVNRPFEEMMLGLEGNVPMYMTGQISPYYLRRSQSDTFCHLLKVSGTAAMSGESIAGNHSSGRYIVTKNKDDVEYYKTRAKHLLKKALPLMDIYRSDRKEQFLEHLRALWKSGDRRIVLSSLPLFTISESLLSDILLRNSIDAENKERIMHLREEYCEAGSNLLNENKIILEIPFISEKEWDERFVSLALSELFYENEIIYTYEEYFEHFKQTKAFAERFANCTLKIDPLPVFSNIDYTIIKNKCVIVSKSKCPAIHFVIHHPKMVRAFENFIPMIGDA